MRAPLVGIVGAMGAVGQIATRVLAEIGLCELRLGARAVDRLQSYVTAQDLRAQVAHVDIDDARSLTSFCDGCNILVNCAGPSFRILDRVARSGLAAGAHYVDPGGDEPVYRKLAAEDISSTGRIVLLTAGMMPGLSALLTRRLLQNSAFQPTRLRVHVGGVGHLSPAGALDYLLSVAHEGGAALAIWKQGQRIARAASPIVHHQIPFFASGCTAYPYLSREMERLARALGIPEVLWFNIFEGEHMLKALGRLQHGVPGLHGPQLESAARELSQAAELDLFGKEPFQLFHLQLDGETAHIPTTYSTVLRGSSAHALTGCLTALATECVLRSEVSPGVHYAGETLPLAIVDRLSRMPEVTTFWEGEMQPEHNHESVEGIA